MIDWLYRTALEVSLLIGLVLILRPLVRRQLGANVAYWLWAIPLIRCLMPDKPEVPAAIMEATNLPDGDLLLRIFPNPEILILPAGVPFEWIWFFGLVSWIVLRFFGWFRLQVYLKNNRSAFTFNGDLQNQILQGSLGNKVTFYRTPIPAAPFVTGLIQPQIYLPDDFAERFNQTQQNWVVVHELNHIKRKDLWMQLVGEVIRAVFWFNPIVHFAWSAFREDQELACDQSVLRQCDANDRYEYGRALIKGLHAHILPATLAFINGKKERFIMLEKHQQSFTKNMLGIALCLLVAVLALTKAPRAIASEESWTQEAMHFNFEKIPLSDLTRIVFDFAKKDVVGLELLRDYAVTVNIASVKPLDAATVLLKCYGFSMQDEGDFYRIHQDYAVDVSSEILQECVSGGMKS